MPYRFFQIPSRGCELTEDDLNQFLGSHRIVSVTRHFVDCGGDSFWSFCVDYLDAADGNAKKSRPRRPSVDYQEKLPPEEFALYAKLRDHRKTVAEKENIPAYAIFTNDHLAKIVQSRATSVKQLLEIADLGEGRVEKYGEGFAKIAAEHWSKESEAGEQLV